MTYRKPAPGASDTRGDKSHPQTQTSLGGSQSGHPRTGGLVVLDSWVVVVGGLGVGEDVDGHDQLKNSSSHFSEQFT